jgi:hypothetical protein
MKILSIDPELPKSLQGIEEKPELFEEISNDYGDFKKYLLKKFNYELPAYRQAGEFEI